MSNRACVNLDDDAYAIYQQIPYHRRGAYLSDLLKADARRAAPLRRRVMARTIIEQIQTLLERLLRVLDE